MSLLFFQTLAFWWRTSSLFHLFLPEIPLEQVRNQAFFSLHFTFIYATINVGNIIKFKGVFNYENEAPSYCACKRFRGII